MDIEVKKYFVEKYKKASFRAIHGSWPDFRSKEEVDEWIEANENFYRYLREQEAETIN